MTNVFEDLDSIELFAILLGMAIAAYLIYEFITNPSDNPISNWASNLSEGTYNQAPVTSEEFGGCILSTLTFGLLGTPCVDEGSMGQ